MFLDWKKTDQYEVASLPEELFEAIITSLANSKLEVRSVETAVESFEIVAALKSKTAYIMSYEGRNSDFRSPFTKISCKDHIVTIETKHSAFASIVLIILVILTFQFVCLGAQLGWVGLLFFVSMIAMILAFWCSQNHPVKKCHNEAVRCVLELISLTEKNSIR